MEIPYLGRFPSEKITPVIEAAAPIPPGTIQGLDGVTGCRAEAIVRRLEWLDTSIKMDQQHEGDRSPSGLKKKFHAIAAAANKLLEALEVNENADPAAMSRQVYNALRWYADQEAELIGGFSNHPPIRQPADDGASVEFNGDRQLEDNVEGVRQVRDWARQAEKLARSRVERPEDIGPGFEVIGMEPWTENLVNDALAGILDIWTQVLGREIHTAVHKAGDNEGEAYGQLIQFALASLRALGIVEGRDGKELGTEAVRARIQRIEAARRKRF
jgi:hypothetical protein